MPIRQKKAEKSDKSLEDIKYAKNQILKSKKYFDSKDILSVLLKEKESYTISETNKIIEEFKNRKVK